MFEAQSPSAPPPPPNLPMVGGGDAPSASPVVGSAIPSPSGVVDMFAEVKEPVSAGSGPAESVLPIGERAARGGLKRLLIVIGAIVILAVVGVVVWVTFFRQRGEEAVSESATGASTTPAEEPAPAEAPPTPPATAPETPATPEPAPAVGIEPQPAEAPAAVDADGDGLSDTEEAGIGTDPQNADTDGDGLSDRDEVRVYHTNPMKADTDGDGFADGVEVRNGFDPNAKGKRLFEVPPAP